MIASLLDPRTEESVAATDELQHVGCIMQGKQRIAIARPARGADLRLRLLVDSEVTNLLRMGLFPLERRMKPVRQGRSGPGHTRGSVRPADRRDVVRGARSPQAQNVTRKPIRDPDADRRG